MTPEPAYPYTIFRAHKREDIQPQRIGRRAFDPNDLAGSLIQRFFGGIGFRAWSLRAPRPRPSGPPRFYVGYNLSVCLVQVKSVEGQISSLYVVRKFAELFRPKCSPRPLTMIRNCVVHLKIVRM
ncbi:hypothetical protein AVEN_132587-1 [Araneus ventricosus]|uniref:Uncharacterized protein n=1 Tax=Araneus ventricosus TaxID=182803 RepID=A0A4Y2W324_ARAVE|nr:hypothetical protein AVEN_132587-1 [Araneus ventricosus]